MKKLVSLFLLVFVLCVLSIGGCQYHETFIGRCETVQETADHAFWQYFYGSTAGVLMAGIIVLAIVVGVRFDTGDL